MNTKPDEQEPAEEEAEVEEIDFMVVTVGDNHPAGLSDHSAKGKSIANLVEALQSVDPNSPDAEANKTSITDNNGGRIELEEDLESPDIIKK